MARGIIARMQTPAVTLYGIPNCDQTRAARHWLADHAVAVTFVDYRETPPSIARITAWIAAVGGATLINRRSTTWRGLNAVQRSSADAPATAATLLYDYPTLIKRPVIVWPSGEVTVGNAPARWQELLAR